MIQNLSKIVVSNPELAAETFNNVEQAFNQVLPGSDAHPRYLEIDEVGLAIVVAKDRVGVSYNPLDKQTLERLDFRADNMAEHPDAWAPGPMDAEILGAPMPDWIGRFTVFALAKINHLSTNQEESSHHVPDVKIAPGVVGYAGGRRLSHDSLVAASGLWEVHDHLAAGIFADEIKTANTRWGVVRTPDNIAANLKIQIANIAGMHAGVPGDQMSRLDVARLIKTVRTKGYIGRI